MQMIDSDVGKMVPTIWDAYKEVVKKHEPWVRNLATIRAF